MNWVKFGNHVISEFLIFLIFFFCFWNWPRIRPPCTCGGTKVWHSIRRFVWEPANYRGVHCSIWHERGSEFQTGLWLQSPSPRCNHYEYDTEYTVPHFVILFTRLLAPSTLRPNSVGFQWINRKNGVSSTFSLRFISRTADSGEEMSVAHSHRLHSAYKTLEEALIWMYCQEG